MDRELFLQYCSVFNEHKLIEECYGRSDDTDDNHYHPKDTDNDNFYHPKDDNDDNF